MTKEEIIQHAETIEGWFPNYDMESLYILADNFIKEGGKVLEVGSWKGRSSYILAALCKERNAHLTCIDSFKGLVLTDHVKYDLYHGAGGYYKEAEKDDFIHFIKDNLAGMPVDLLKGDSRQFYDTFPYETFDLIFLDGDHDYPIVGEDVINFWPRVKVGGVYCGHDYEHPNDVSKAVDFVFKPEELRIFRTIWSVERKF